MMWWSAPVFSFVFSVRGPSCFVAEAIVSGFKDVTVMSKAIEESCCHHRVQRPTSALLEASARCHSHRAS